MPQQEEINDLTSLLVAYRRRLSYHLDQKAVLGSVPPGGIVDEIRDSRERIKDIKVMLYDAGHPMADHPDDGFTINPQLPDSSSPPAKNHKIVHNALTKEEIDRALAQLPNWISATIRIANEGHAANIELGQEIMRVYRFATFKDAISFMGNATEFIDLMDHHPRWENAYRTVTVWLSSWDIGQRISKRDIDLAQKLDELFKSFIKGA